MTQKYKLLKNLFLTISILLTIGPGLVFLCMAYNNDTAIINKFTLSMMLLVIAIMTIVAISQKIVLRSRLWILLIGLWMCLDHFIVPLIVIGICQILDELIISPLYNYYKNIYRTNKVIDERDKYGST